MSIIASNPPNNLVCRAKGKQHDNRGRALPDGGGRQSKATLTPDRIGFCVKRKTIKTALKGYLLEPFINLLPPTPIDRQSHLRLFGPLGSQARIGSHAGNQPLSIHADRFGRVPGNGVRHDAGCDRVANQRAAHVDLNWQ